jgi:peptidoglycan/LPS O-acetylase OafA/YrhL
VERLGHVPALDGLRAVAVTCVIAFHATGYPRAGWLGVDLFFVLSGFLITTLLMEERGRDGRVSFHAFYRRRALRLFPALFVMLAVVAVVTAAQSRSFLGVTAGALYFANFLMAVDPAAVPDDLTHLWSLAAEEQFYFVWPLVLFLVLTGRRRVGLIVATGGALAATAWGMYLHEAGATWSRVAFAPDTRSIAILVGCALALVRPPTTRGLGYVALPLVISLFVLDFQRVVGIAPTLILFAISSAALIAACREKGMLAVALSIPPAVFLGRISYGLYLWHVPIFVALGAKTTDPGAATVVAVALTLVAAIASYYLVELPFLRRKHTSQTLAPRPVPAAAPS